MKPLLSLLALALLLLGGCAVKAPEQGAITESEILEATEAAFGPVNECIEACSKTTISLENGPCLLNPMSNPEWVCDVAHEPREDIDNQIENQCSAYREGKARHFVEVSPDCEFIKKY